MAEEHRSLRIVWLLGLLILVGSTAGTAWYLHPWSPDALAAPKLNVTAPVGVVAQGHVDVKSRIVPLFPTQPGRVVKVLVTEGQTVSKAGDPLIEMNDQLALARRDEARAALKAAQAQLKLASGLEAQNQLKERQQQAAIRIAEEVVRGAEADLRRQKKLFEGKAVSAEIVDVAEAQVGRARATVDAENARLEELQAHFPEAALNLGRAEAEEDAAKARLAQAELAVQECVIRAPTPGKVLRLEVAVGDMLTVQPLQPPIMFCPDEPLIVRAEVDQEDVGRVHVGDEATVTDETGTDQRKWTGEVVYVSDWLARRRSILLEPGQLNDVRTLECIIQLKPNEHGLRIGERVRVHIQPRK